MKIHEFRFFVKRRNSKKWGCFLTIFMFVKMKNMI